MLLKDVSPIKMKVGGLNTNGSILSANAFNDQLVESEGNPKPNWRSLVVNTGNNSVLPQIDSSRTKKIVQTQNIPSSILEEMYQKRQHVNPTKQVIERRRNSIEKAAVNTHYYSTKSFINQTPAQKSNSLNTMNQSPMANSSNKILHVINTSSLNNLHNTFNNGANNNSSIMSNTNGQQQVNQVELQVKRNHSLKVSVPTNSMDNYEAKNNGVQNSSFINISSFLNHQSSVYSQKNLEEVQAMRKLDSKDNLYAKLILNDKKMVIETDLSKLKSNIIANNTHQRSTQVSFSVNSTPLHVNGPTSIHLNPTTINKSALQSQLYSNILGSSKRNLVSHTQREFKNFMDQESDQVQFVGRNTLQELKSPIVSPLNISKIEEASKRNSYITQIIKDDLKKEILSKSEIKEILNGVQKEFGYMKVSQNNLKKGSERKDVVELSQWFDQMTVSLLEKDNFTLDSFMEEYEIIYSGCLSEISRQVSNDCFERGQLLEKLWKIILFIQREFVKKAQQKYRQSDLQMLQEYGRIHHSYQNQIKDFQNNQLQQTQVIEQKDVLIRKLYQQKESTKKKYKKYELLYSILYEDFEFLERYLDKMNFQNLVMKQKISAYEAQERLYIKDSDPKLKIKEEINRISQILSDQYIVQLEDQKSLLQELYEIKKDARQKLQVIEKNLDFEFKNGKLEKKGGLDINLVDGDDIQLDDNYGQIQMNDQETNTEDLVTFAEMAIDTSDLFKKESKGTNTWIQTEETEVQATVTTKEMGTQADIKKFIGGDGEGISKRINDSLQEVMSEYEEMKLPLEQLKRKNYNIDDQIEYEYKKWVTKNKEMVTAFQQKDEYTSNDYKYLRSYLDQHALRTKEFMLESIAALIKEQQMSLSYKIETFETHLDNQIVKEKMQFQTSTLKKIIPKYNELKKENNILSQSQAQAQFQAGKDSNKSLNGRRTTMSFQQQFNKQSSLTYLEPYSDSPDRKSSRRQIEQSSQLSLFTQRSPKRHNTTKMNESQSPTKSATSSILMKQKSQSNIGSNNSPLPFMKKKLDGSSNVAINKMKIAIQKINSEYKSIQNIQSSSNLQNDSSSMSSLPDVSNQLRAKVNFGTLETEQEQSQVDDVNLSLTHNIDGAQSNRDNIEGRQSKTASIHQSLQNLDEKQQTDKVTDISIDSKLLPTKNSSQNEIQIEAQGSQDAKNNQTQKGVAHQITSQNAILQHILEQPEPDEATTTPLNKAHSPLSPRKNNFNEENIQKLQAQIDRKANQIQLFQNNVQNNPEDSDLKAQEQEDLMNSNQEQPVQIDQNIQSRQKLRSPKKKLTIQEQSNSEIYIEESDLSSGSENEKDKPFVTNREQIQDQMYDKKYLDEAAAEEAIREQAENDEFELALRNLDSSVNTVQPNPNINSRMRIHASTSKFTDLATEYLIKSFKEMKKKKNSNFFFKLTQILRTIFTIISDINKVSFQAPYSPTNKYNNPNPTKYHVINHFHVHLFEQLMTSYGTGQLMFKKYFRIVNGIFKYKKHPRINIVSKFLTGEYDMNDFQLFTKLCIFLYPDLQSNEERILITSSKCSEALNHFLYSNFNQKQIENIEKIISKIKIKGVQKNQHVYDFDQILEIIMDNFVKDVKIFKTQEYSDLYYSQDTDKRDYFNFESFKSVLQYIQGQSTISVSNLFYKESDKIMNGESLLSLHRFSLICRQNKILSQAMQQKYLSNTSEQFISELTKIWSEEQYNIKLRLIKVKKYDMKRRKMLNEIEIFLNDSTKSRHTIKTIHFVYNLLQQESKELLFEEHIQSLVPQQFHLISEKYHSIIKSRFNQSSL